MRRNPSGIGGVNDAKKRLAKEFLRYCSTKTGIQIDFNGGHGLGVLSGKGGLRAMFPH